MPFWFFWLSFLSHIYYYHHQIILITAIPLTLSHHLFLSSITFDRSSRLPPVDCLQCLCPVSQHWYNHVWKFIRECCLRVSSNFTSCAHLVILRHEDWDAFLHLLVVLMEFFHKDAEKNIHPFSVSWYFSSSSFLCFSVCSCIYIYIYIYMYVCECVCVQRG